MMSSRKTRYAIIGGGIAGASITYHLSRCTDDPITLYEKGSLASETTYKSMALLGGRQGDNTSVHMKSYALQLYNEFFADTQANPEFHLLGSMAVATSQEGSEIFKRSAQGTEEIQDRLVKGSHNDPVEYLAGEEIHEAIINPQLRTEEITGVLYQPKRGYTIPNELTFEFIERARDNGAEIEINTPITDISVEDGQVSTIKTDSETLNVDQVICAAGPWNPHVARMVGLDIPVKHTLAPIMKLQPSVNLPNIVPHTKHYKTRIYFRGCHDGSVFVGHNPTHLTSFDEAKQYNPSEVNQTFPDPIRSQAMEIIKRLYPFLLEADIVSQWVGLRSMTPDGMPIVGWTPVDGFSIAAFNSSGINLSPAVGKIISRQLIDNDPTEHYNSLSITRFEGFNDNEN
jgi:glycine/D-amino acid oxidase-like deaminating enzyme